MPMIYQAVRSVLRAAVGVFYGEVESRAVAEIEGVGVRVIAGQRQGYAWAGSLDDDVIADTLADARDNAGFGSPDEFYGLADPATFGDVQAVDLFTTQSAIPANDFVVLDDPKSNFAAQNVLPLINKAKANDTVTAALNAVSAKLTTDGLQELNTEADSDAKPSPETVAKNWLSKNGLA